MLIYTKSDWLICHCLLVAWTCWMDGSSMMSGTESIVKHIHLPRIIVGKSFVQFMTEIWAIWCPYFSIQISLIFPRFLQFWTGTKLNRFVWRKQDWTSTHFSSVNYSKCLIKSHNLTNSIIILCTASSLQYVVWVQTNQWSDGCLNVTYAWGREISLNIFYYRV